MFPSLILSVCSCAPKFLFLSLLPTQEKRTHARVRTHTHTQNKTEPNQTKPHLFLLGEGSTRTTQNILRMSKSYWTSASFSTLSFSPHIFRPGSQGVKLTYKGISVPVPQLEAQESEFPGREMSLWAARRHLKPPGKKEQPFMEQISDLHFQGCGETY